MSGGRADDPQYARRVNAAAQLLAAGVSRSDAVRSVAQQFSVSSRQGSRYVEAAAGGPVEVPETRTVFTVKVPVSLVARVREYARASGGTISGVVITALTEFLARRHGGERKADQEQ